MPNHSRFTSHLIFIVLINVEYWIVFHRQDELSSHKVFYIIHRATICSSIVVTCHELDRELLCSFGIVSSSYCNVFIDAHHPILVSTEWLHVSAIHLPKHCSSIFTVNTELLVSTLPCSQGCIARANFPLITPPLVKCLDFSVLRYIHRHVWIIKCNKSKCNPKIILGWAYLITLIVVVLVKWFDDVGFTISEHHVIFVDCERYQRDQHHDR